MLFIDARHIYRQTRPRPPRLHAGADRVPRQHRAPLPRRSMSRRTTCASDESDETAAWDEHSLTASTATCPGLCKVATLDEIEAQGWSLNPGRYVGVAEREADDFDFASTWRS